MKNLISIVIIGLLLTGCGGMKKAKIDAISWVSVSDLEALVKKKPRKILVDVYTPWCGPCKMMDQGTFTDKKVIDVMTNNFYSVKFNAEGPEKVNFKGKEYSNPGYKPARAKSRNTKHELSSFFAVRGYPSIVVMDENMKIIDTIVGYRKPAQLLQALEKHM